MFLFAKKRVPLLQLVNNISLLTREKRYNDEKENFNFGR